MKSQGGTLITVWGLAPDFASRVAPMLEQFETAGLNPVITSGWRDPKHQAELRRRWDAGDRRGLRARPAASSLHCRTVAGQRAAYAIDIDTSDAQRAAEIAVRRGVGAGYFYRTPDPVHFYMVQRISSAVAIALVLFIGGILYAIA